MISAIIIYVLAAIVIAVVKLFPLRTIHMNIIIMYAVMAAAHAIAMLSRLWIIHSLFINLGSIWFATLALALPALRLDSVGGLDVIGYLATLAAMTVAVMPRYFAWRYSIIQAACILLGVIAISGFIVGELLEGRKSIFTDFSWNISALLVILVELVSLKKFFGIEASLVADDSFSLTDERINRFILAGLLFQTATLSAYSLLSLEGIWIRYLHDIGIILTVYYFTRYFMLGVERLDSYTKEKANPTSYRHPWHRAHKSLCTLNLAVGIIGHHVVSASIAVGIWMNGYPAEWPRQHADDQITSNCQSL